MWLPSAGRHRAFSGQSASLVISLAAKASLTTWVAAHIRGVIGAVSGVTIGQAQYAFGVFVGPIAEEFPEWSRVQINAATSVGMVVMSLSSPVLGWLVDKVGVRVVVPLAA